LPRALSRRRSFDARARPNGAAVTSRARTGRVAPDLTRNAGMSKGMDKKKETKKKAEKTLKEKRAVKQAKKAARGH
jgi:hypothetical protein